MSATLHIFKTALDDLQNALDWYESQSNGLESRFSKAVNERLSFIADYPEASSIRVEGFRGAQLKKFPCIWDKSIPYSVYEATNFPNERIFSNLRVDECHRKVGLK